MKKLLTLLAVVMMATGAWAEETEPYITIQKSGGFAATKMTEVDTRSDSDVSAIYEVDLEAGNHKFWFVTYYTKDDGTAGEAKSGDYNITVPVAGKVKFFATHIKKATYTSVICNSMNYCTIDAGWVMYARLTANVGASSSEYYFLSKDNGNYKRLQLAYTNTYQNKPTDTKTLMLIPSTGSEIAGLQITSQAVKDRICKAVLDYTTGTLAYSAVETVPVKVSAAGAATVVFPVAATIPEGVTAYTLKRNGGTTLVATKIEGNTLPANTPALINADEGVYNFSIGDATATFETGTAKHNNNDKTYIKDVEPTDDNALTGVLMPHVVPNNSYVLQNGANGVGFYNVGTLETDYVIDPFHAYIAPLAAAPSRLTIVFPDSDDQTTAISDALRIGDNREGVVYNLAGQRVDSNFKGVVVKNGRKTIQK